MLDRNFKKEKPFTGFDGFGGGAGGLITGGLNVFEGRGGQFFNPGDGYFYHLFEGAGTHTLELKQAGVVDIYLVGGGGGTSTPGSGPPGVPGTNKSATSGSAGGSVQGNGLTLTAGTYNFQIGGGGANAVNRFQPAPGGFNGGGNGGIAVQGPTSIPSERGAGGGGGGYTRFYGPTTTYLAAGGGGGGARQSTSKGGGNPTNPILPNSTSGENGYTAPPTVPGSGGNGGGGSGGGFDGTGGGGGVASGNGGASYASPQFSSTAFYQGGGGGFLSPEPSGQTGPIVTNSAPPARIWIPQEPTTSGNGTKAMNNEASPSNKVNAEGGYAIIRYAANNSASAFNRPGIISNLTPHIPGNGYEYFVMTSPGSVSVAKDTNVEVLAVAGGGGAGPSNGGGGGGVVISTVPLTVGSYPITVGTAGPAGANGNDTTAFGVTATGGRSDGTAGAGGGSGNSGNGGNGTQATGFHPFYVGLTEEKYLTAPGLPNSIPGSAYYGGGGGTPPGNGGLGGAGQTVSADQNYQGFDTFGGGGSRSPGGAAGGGDGVVIFRIQI